jgi:hypothetical protein
MFFDIDIEEITHKAGNFKKFSIFTNMLLTALKKESENVFVDLLTLNDLEILKARKLQHQQTSQSMESGLRSQTNTSLTMKRDSQKRYLILTYTGKHYLLLLILRITLIQHHHNISYDSFSSFNNNILGEFDRVHYPLPLGFELTPNALALQKTIKRLRNKLAEKRVAEFEPSSDRERELRTLVSKLRQDNSELRHRLKISVPGGLPIPGTPDHHLDPNSSHNVSLTNANADLVKENRNLRQKNESLTRENSEYIQLIEKMKRQSALEIAKWKQKISGNVHPNSKSLLQEDSQQQHQQQQIEQLLLLLQEYKRKYLALDRELKLERLSRGKASSHSIRGGAGGGGGGVSGMTSNNNNNNNSRGRSRARSASPIISTTNSNNHGATMTSRRVASTITNNNNSHHTKRYMSPLTNNNNNNSLNHSHNNNHSHSHVYSTPRSQSSPHTSHNGHSGHNASTRSRSSHRNHRYTGSGTGTGTTSGATKSTKHHHQHPQQRYESGYWSAGSQVISSLLSSLIYSV